MQPQLGRSTLAAPPSAKCSGWTNCNYKHFLARTLPQFLVNQNGPIVCSAPTLYLRPQVQAPRCWAVATSLTPARSRPGRLPGRRHSRPARPGSAPPAGGWVQAAPPGPGARGGTRGARGDLTLLAPPRARPATGLRSLQATESCNGGILTALVAS